ncbi:branched-chain amino acid ABC transporter permease [Paralimibaculum aggregatum]|uniref:Branched-chain amino acid ABC transporter permease n=1 Tax=Paralimibaculum aggregatum TaxID=3036245 RepID=A0ABQ6LIY4_9RHOB|nr:branched-chain amino acid ABC transporter permease [Limibaculum sp. NKW23]GMG81148.1 branched-chain amino acid ABC transporter permease [Limibaculum sp. NKW23]
MAEAAAEIAAPARRRLPEWAVNAAIAAALLAWPLLADAAGEPWWAGLAAKAAILALAGVGLNLALGYGGMVSLGHAAFFGIGGYVAAISADAAFSGAGVLGLPGSDRMLPIWLAAMALSALVALGIGAISLRTEGVYFIMITLAFAQMIYYLAISWPAYGGEDGMPIYLRNGFPGMDTNAPLDFALVCLGALAAALLLSWRLTEARFGRALICARMNPLRLATLGMEPFPVKLAAFVISAAITGLAGALYADLNGYVSPAMLGWHTSGEIIVFVILGGTGRLFGPVAGAVLYVWLETLLGGVTVHWQMGLGLVLLGVVLFGRGGLIGLLCGARRHG